MLETFPKSVRYVKNGAGGQWWAAAKTNGEVHLGWRSVPHALLQTGDLAAIEGRIRSANGNKASAKQSFNALRSLLDHPSQHLWVTFQDGCMWWCAVHDEIETNLEGETSDRGHFWLTCASPWSNRSVSGRHLTFSSLPGIVASTAGYRATVCEPKGWREILRVIQDEEDADAIAAIQARKVYEDAVAKLVARLGDKDFEVLVDLILARTGWARLAKLGGVTEGVDVEVENAATGEIAFVQVKSSAKQTIFDDYVLRFNGRRERYARMIFAVHTGTLTPPDGQAVQVWTGNRVAQLVVSLGLGDWVAKRI